MIRTRVERFENIQKLRSRRDISVIYRWSDHFLSSLITTIHTFHNMTVGLFVAVVLFSLHSLRQSVAIATMPRIAGVEAPGDAKFSTLFSIGSISAWITLALAAHYFQLQLSDPCTAFQLLHAPVAKRKPFDWFRRNQTPGSACLENRDYIWEQLACLLPELLFDANDYTHTKCRDNDTALWTLLPFYTAILLSAMSAVFELYLLLFAGPFRQDATAFTSLVKALRNMLFSVLETSAINATLVCSNILLDVGLLYSLFFGVAALAPVLYFDKEPCAPFYMATIEVLVASIVIFRRSTDGSNATIFLLTAACVLRAVAILVGRLTPSQSAACSFIYTGSLICLYLAIVMVGNHDISFPMSIQDYKFPQGDSMYVWGMCLMEACLGFGFTMAVSNQTYEAFHTMLNPSAPKIRSPARAIPAPPQEAPSQEVPPQDNGEGLSTSNMHKSFVSIMESKPPLAATALGLTVQDWSVLGFGDDPDVAASPDLNVTVDRLASLILVRIAAVREVDRKSSRYPDLSTSTICRTALINQIPWPSSITDEVIGQLRDFVYRILSGYKEVPYHNFEHAYHVTLSVNKLVDLMLQKQGAPHPTYGLAKDPLMHLALLFSALIHDVEHQGIPNRQLSIEEDELAILYNDMSIAEQHSLHVGFSTLLEDDFADLRAAMFSSNEEFLRFRKAVLNLVFNTDIASPERTQIAKSKWKEAFGEPFETVERKVRTEVARRASGSHIAPMSIVMQRRGSNYSVRSDVSNLEQHETVQMPEHHETDESESETPDTSYAEEDPYDPLDGVVVSGYTLSTVSNSPEGARDGPVRSGSISDLPVGSIQQKFQRRFSSASMTMHGKRKRLGIRRSVDFSGEQLETYSTRAGASNETAGEDEPDELKATVVMETIMMAADVAHNLQGWDHMVKWSDRLYMELRKAHAAGRGGDPQGNWFENQIGFLDFYLLPMARRLEDTKVFGEATGWAFANIVTANRDRWMADGFAVATNVISQGAERYPDDCTKTGSF
jgi:hypothetical protein